MPNFYASAFEICKYDEMKMTVGIAICDYRYRWLLAYVKN